MNDGRRLGFAEYGDPQGFPVMYFHGNPSSRLEPEILRDAWTAHGLRVVAPDRPGIGLSAWQPSRVFRDWPRDVEQLANYLEWQSFAVLGNSGGGPYAAACAAQISDRISAAVVISGAWRMDSSEAKEGLNFLERSYWMLAKRFPPGFRLLLRMMGKSSSAPESLHQEVSEETKKQLGVMFPPPDIAALIEPGRMRAFHLALMESMRTGTRGPAWDARMFVRPFGFDHKTIPISFHVFHGKQDRNVPLHLVEKYVAEIPKAELTVWESEGHISALCNHIDEIARTIRR